MQRFMAGAIGLMLATTVAQAQDTGGFRWSLSTGPTMSLSNKGHLCSGPDQFNCSGPPITGGRDGRFHVGVGVSHPVGSTALVFRADALYSAASSRPNSWSMIESRFAARNALRDEWYSLGLGFQWDARPAKSWSPYLLTSAGLAFNRVGWNETDVESREVNRWDDRFGLFGALGAGARVRVSGVELFSEVKRHYSPTLSGARPVPFSFGIRF